MTECYHCHAPTTNGLALCQLSLEAARTYLTAIPVYFRNLARERRPGRPNGSLGTSGQWLLKHGDSDDGSLVQRALARAVNDLTTWTRTLIDDRGVEPPDADDETQTVVALCGFLAEHLTSIATLEWAGQFVRDMSRHEKALRQITEIAVPGWYAGACRQPAGRDMDGNEHVCGADIHVVPGLTWVTCQRCSATTHAADHLPAILDEAREWVARPKALAEALVALLDTEESVPRLYARIRQWAKREDIPTIKRTMRDHVYDDESEEIVVADVEVGFARYRFGDVFDRVLLGDAPTVDASQAS
jgi:hypothetical protein